MLTSLSEDVIVYLYKCLLRRQQALQLLRPIDGDLEQFGNALAVLASAMKPDDISEADKQIRLSSAAHLQIYVDASARDHDDPSVPNRVSVSLIVSVNGEVLYEKAEYLGSHITLMIQDKPVTLDITVNVAEYLALIKALEFVVDNEFRGSVTIYSDSLLVVSQMNFMSSTRAPKLVVLRDYAHRLKNRLRNVEIVHLSREENTSADALARATTEEPKDE